MEWIYKYISWGAIIASSIGGIGISIRYLIQKKIDSYFNKKLETYKQELTIITENAKYDISKKLFDFEAYATKKHLVYPELYSQVHKIWWELKRFKVAFKEHYSDKDALEQDFNEKFITIGDNINIAYDYFYKNELYLSKNTATAYARAINAQTTFLEKILESYDKNINDDNWYDTSFLIKVDEKIYNNASDKIGMLREIIYEELSYTHSENGI